MSLDPVCEHVCICSCVFLCVYVFSPCLRTYVFLYPCVSVYIFVFKILISKTLLLLFCECVYVHFGVRVWAHVCHGTSVEVKDNFVGSVLSFPSTWVLGIELSQPPAARALPSTLSRQPLHGCFNIVQQLPST